MGEREDGARLDLALFGVCFHRVNADGSAEWLPAQDVFRHPTTEDGESDE